MPVQPTPAHIALLNERLQIHWDKAKCEICQASSWKTSGHIYELRGFSGGNIVVGAPVPVSPVVVIHCQECGNTKLVSAIALGVIDPTTGARIDG